MITNKLIVVIRKMVLFIFLLGAMDVAIAADSKSVPDISINLEVDNTTYTVGEPIDLVASLHNNSDSPNRLGSSFNTGQGHLNFYVSVDRVKYKRYRGPYWGVVDTAGVGRGLQAKSTKTQNIRILHNSPRIPKLEVTGHMAFPNEGRYYLKAAMRYRDVVGGYLESNVVELKLTAPEGDNAQVFEALNSSGSIFFLHTGHFEVNDDIQRYRDILDQHPNSIYTKYLKESLEIYKVGQAEQLAWKLEKARKLKRGQTEEKGNQVQLNRKTITFDSETLSKR